MSELRFQRSSGGASGESRIDYIPRIAQIRSPHTVRIFTPVLKDIAYVDDITGDMLDYRRTIRFQGGYWQANFRLQAPLNDLIRIFNNWLGYHFEESVGGVTTWEGMIYEMTLNLPFTCRIKTLDVLANSVKATYLSGSSTATTAAATQTESIARYGQKEELLSLDQLNSTTATALRDTYLKENAWPWPRPQDQGAGEAFIDFICCGYVFCANWRYTTTADGSSSNVGAWISSIVSTDLTEFLRSGFIAANSLALTKTLQTPQRCWDQMLDLTSLGDASGNLYRLWVENNRYINYKQVSTTPEYYIFKGNIVPSMAQSSNVINPYFVKPGVFRDMDWPIQNTDPGSYLTDARDMIIEEISVGANSGLSWRSLEFSEAEIIQQQKEYEASLEKASASTSGKKKGIDWYERYAKVHKIKSIKEAQAIWQGMTLNERNKWKKTKYKEWKKKKKKK